MTKPPSLTSPISRRTFGALGALPAAMAAGVVTPANAQETAAPAGPVMNHLIGTIYQVCFVVTDLEAAVKHWTEKLKIGPFLMFENFTFTDPDGASLPTNISLALAYSGDNFIELIKLNSGRPTIYDAVTDTGGGFHHLAKLTNDLDASIAEAEAAGHPLAFLGHFEPDARLAYVDARSTYGGYMEYVEYNETIAGLLHYMRAGAERWDGVTPTMPFPEAPPE